MLHHDAAKNWLRIDGYFKFFEGLIIHSVQIRELHDFLIQKHLIAYFIDFIMEKGSPLNIFPKKYSIGSKTNPANFSHAINMILFLIKKVKIHLCRVLDLRARTMRYLNWTRINCSTCPKTMCYA